MISALRFDPPHAVHGGRLLRRVHFEPASSLPISAMCVVANGVREQLAHLLAVEIELELVEPAIPRPQDKAVLFFGALVYRVRGRLCDAFLVVRPGDAVLLAGAAFREAQRDAGAPLSAIERQTVDRIAASLAPQCTSLCGAVAHIARDDPARAQSECSTYFEVRTTQEPRIAIGFALNRDPAEAIGDRVGLDRLLDVQLQVRVELARGSIGVPAFVNLRTGSMLALDTGLHERGSLRIDGVTLASVECGERSGRCAVVVEALGNAA